MAENKTQRTALSVDEYLNAIEDAERKKDCREISAIMKRISGHEPFMYGTAIVGFEEYHYKYESGREGNAPSVGFASRKGDISVYLLGGYEDAAAQALLSELGKHKVGKGCLYIKRLADVKTSVLEKLIVRGLEYARNKYRSK